MSSDDSVDKYLAQKRSDGEFDSKGQFRLSLSSAKRKLAEFGQATTEEWTLLFARAFLDFGYRRVDVSQDGSHWRFVLSESICETATIPKRLVDTNLTFHSSTNGESELIMGLCGISNWPLLQACWLNDGEVTDLLSESSESCQPYAPSFEGFSIVFEPGLAPAFPRQLWTQRLSFSPLTVCFQGERLNDQAHNSRLGQVLCPKNPLWLEYLSESLADESLVLSEVSRPRFRRLVDGEPQKEIRHIPTAALSWWSDQGRLEHFSLIVLLRQELAGPSEFHPVKSGCLLEAHREEYFPPGFDVVFSADALPTDLSQSKLLVSDQLQKHLMSLVPVFLQSLSLLEMLVGESEKVIKRPKTPFVADVPPAALGFMSLLTLASAFSLPAMIPVAGLLAAPSALHYTVSRRARRKEFKLLREQSLALIKDRQSALESWLPTLTDN